MNIIFGNYRSQNSLTIETEKTRNNSKNMKNLVNLDRLAEISGGDWQFEQELLQAYLEDMKVLQEQIQKAIAAEDFATIRYHLHTIKGSSSNIGCFFIEEIASTLEKKVTQQESISSLISLMDELESRFAYIEDFFTTNFTKS